MESCELCGILRRDQASICDVWFCKLHYEELKPQIEKAMKDAAYVRTMEFIEEYQRTAKDGQKNYY